MSVPVPVPVGSIRAQVERITASRRFGNSERQRKLLQYLLEETLAGRSPQLKEYIIGVEVFGRAEGFDPQTDPIVRTELSRLRLKLKDYYENDGREDALVVDLPKRSFALTFEPREIAAAASGRPAVWPFGTRRTPLAAFGAIALVAVLGLARPGNRPAPPETSNLSPASIAVLPFVTVGADVQTEYFSDGLTEELIHRLAEIDGLRVVSRTSAFQFKGKQADVRSIATQLGVEAVLEGTVRRSGDRVRVTARLINAADGCELLSNAYDRQADDVLTMQEEIASQLASTLRVHQLGRRGIPIKQFAHNAAAYRLYLEGRYHANERSQLRLGKAIECYEQAIAADPNYAPAYARLADAYLVLSLLGEVSPHKARDRAKQAALQAVRTGDGLPEAHSALASVLALYDWDWPAAQSEFHKALALDPNDSGILEEYATRYLLPQGRLDSALAELKLAGNLDPFSPQILLGLGRVHYYQRDPESAIRLFQKVLHLEPSFEAVPLALATAYLAESRADRALATLQEASAPTEDEARLALLGYVYARSGKPDRARQILRQLQELGGHQYVSGYYLALIQIGLGDKPQAFAQLEKAAAERSPLVLYLNVCPLFDTVRAEPRFAALLRKVGLGG